MENNTGVLPPKIKETDWMVGAEGIIYKEVCQDWTPYLPVYEKQQKLYTATQACVTFSLLNCIETQLKQQGIDINLSDRFTAKMSGTTASGNQMANPPYSLRHDGWLLEEDYPFPENITFNEYYKEIPQELKDKAKKNYENANWDIQYEWVNMGNCQPDLEALKEQLKQAPLHRATSFASKLCVAEHATEVYKIDDTGIYIFDSYNGGITKNPLTYPMPWIQKVVVVPKSPTDLLIPPITHDLKYGMMNNEEVKLLQRKLIKLGYLSKGLATGNYLNLTQLAVKKFQLDYKVASPIILAWNQGKLVAQSTRTKLNSL